MHHQVLDVAVGNAVVRIENNAVAYGELAVLGHLGAERLDHAGHLEAGEESGVAHPVMREGHRDLALDGHVGGEAAASARGRGQAGQARRSSGMITGTGAHYPDAGTVRRHIRHGHIEAEDAIPPGHTWTLDRHLTAQFIHLLSATQKISEAFTDLSPSLISFHYFTSHICIFCIIVVLLFVTLLFTFDAEVAFYLKKR